MADTYEVPDSTDWLPTPLKDFAALENALHCQICKEFYDTPMITSCNHTFCSRCIRTSLSADGKCPACRSSDQASKLRNNWAIQEVVTTFQAARPTALKVALEMQHGAEQPKTTTGKRKRPTVLDSDDVNEAEVGGRTTRSKSRRIQASQSSQPEAIEIGDSEEEEEEELKVEPPPKDGRVECPLGCGKRMKEEEVFNHLDRCEDEQKQAARAKSRTPLNGFVSSKPPSNQGARPQDRINELSYGMLKESVLSKKLREQGIPHLGSKQLLINRHREWVNIWNANCDSSNPRSRRDLLRELDVWERTQGGKAPQSNGLNGSIMRKDFDGDAYSKRHNDDFSRLIANAKRIKSNPATASGSLKDDAGQDPSKEETLNGDVKSAHFESHPPPLTGGDQAIQNSATGAESLKTAADPKPYAHDPKALSHVREKVQAINEGHTPEPALNEGFRNPATDIPSAEAPPMAHKIESPSKQAQEPPSMFNSTTASTQPPGRPLTETTTRTASLARQGSRDEHTVHQPTGSPCDLPAHVISEDVKKVPMFAVPEQPFSES